MPAGVAEAQPVALSAALPDAAGDARAEVEEQAVPDAVREAARKALPLPEGGGEPRASAGVEAVGYAALLVVAMGEACAEA